MTHLTHDRVRWEIRDLGLDVSDQVSLAVEMLRQTDPDGAHRAKFVDGRDVRQDWRAAAAAVYPLVLHDNDFEAREVPLMWFRFLSRGESAKADFRRENRICGLSLHGAKAILCRADLALPSDVVEVVAHEVRHLRNVYLRDLGKQRGEEYATAYGRAVRRWYCGSSQVLKVSGGPWYARHAQSGDIAVERGADGRIVGAWRRTNGQSSERRDSWSTTLFPS